MIKINELRAGNWVDNGAGDRYIIDTSWFIDIISFAQENGDTNVKGIPLTEEWLIKFGFEKVEETLYESFDKSFGVENGFTTMSWMENTLSIDMMDIKCEYVHTLQNLYFALTGEELTIK